MENFLYRVVVVGCMLALLLDPCAQAQNIGINTSGAAANSSAILDLNTGNTYTSPNGKGLLIPNVSLTINTDAVTIASPSTSLLVYNTNASMTNGNGKGYYYNSGTPASPIWSSVGSNVVTSFSTGSGDWTLAGVVNRTCCGTSGDEFNPTPFIMANNKEYLIIPVGFSSGSELFTLTTSDAVAVFGPSTRINNAVVSQDQVVAFFSSPGGNPCSGSSYTGFLVISGKLKNAGLSGTIVNYGGSLNTFCGAPAISIRLKGNGEIGFFNGDTNADIGLYIFER